MKNIHEVIQTLDDAHEKILTLSLAAGGLREIADQLAEAIAAIRAEVWLTSPGPAYVQAAIDALRTITPQMRKDEILALVRLAISLLESQTAFRPLDDPPARDNAQL